MLTKVEIKNINSIVEATIDFTKCKYQYKDNMVYNNKVVSPVAFYGTNGSGKSSFLTAISQLITLLTSEPTQIHPFIPHFRSEKVEEVKEHEGKEQKVNMITEETSSIRLFFELNKDLFEYFIETSIQGFINNEILIKNSEELFKREKDNYYYQGKSIEVVSKMFPTLRALDIDKNDESIHLCYDYLSNIGFIDAAKRQFQLKIAQQKSYYDIIVEKSNATKEILSKYKEFPLYDVQSSINELGEKQIVAIINHNSGELVLPWSLVSSGMKNQSMLLSAVLSIPENGVLVVDELDDALHPITILDFISAVKEKNIQLIFSSHNTFILQSLRPDQIFFANWENGFSKYKRLSEIYPNIREINNIEKMYLSNLFEEDIKK